MSKYTAIVMFLSMIASGTLLALTWMNDQEGLSRSRIRGAHIDTVFVRSVDTVLVVPRAADTVRIIQTDIGPLTNDILAAHLCPPHMRGRDVEGQARFQYNTYGHLFCPKPDGT